MSGRPQIGFAECRIKPGDKVLIRGNRVRLAGDDIANGVARTLPKWCRSEIYEPGDSVSVEPIEGLGGRDLHAMANAPLMDANRLFLPAGRLTMDEYRARVAADLSDHPA